MTPTEAMNLSQPPTPMRGIQPMLPRMKIFKIPCLENLEWRDSKLKTREKGVAFSLPEQDKA